MDDKLCTADVEVTPRKRMHLILFSVLIVAFLTSGCSGGRKRPYQQSPARRLVDYSARSSVAAKVNLPRPAWAYYWAPLPAAKSVAHLMMSIA